MNRKMMFLIIRVLIVLFLIGCAASTPTLILTISENTCTLEGPMTIAYGEFMIKLVIHEQKPTDSGYALATLADGKTIQDLHALTSMEQPPWVNLIDGVHEKYGGNHTYSYDLTKVASSYHGEPLYLVCARADPNTGITTKLGAFGPIQVIR